MVSYPSWSDTFEELTASDVLDSFETVVESEAICSFEGLVALVVLNNSDWLVQEKTRSSVGGGSCCFCS